ncbi:MAG: hypothetical protein ACYCX3_01460 [Thermoleophilia bacterium]
MKVWNARELNLFLAAKRSSRLYPLWFTPATPAVAVLFMSGYTGNAIAHNDCLDEGIDFLEKAFSPVTLLRKTRKVLGRSGEGRAERPR